jgi:hypothetical protein
MIPTKIVGGHRNDNPVRHKLRDEITKARNPKKATMSM